MPVNFHDFVPARGMRWWVYFIIFWKVLLERGEQDLTIVLLDHPRVQGLDKIDPQTYSTTTLNRPVVREIVSKWSANLKHPYVGVTSDGKCKENLFDLADDGAPVEEMVSTTTSSRIIDHDGLIIASYRSRVPITWQLSSRLQS